MRRFETGRFDALSSRKIASGWDWAKRAAFSFWYRPARFGQSSVPQLFDPVHLLLDRSLHGDQNDAGDDRNRGVDQEEGLQSVLFGDWIDETS